ncbi:hypothetical protein EDC26_11425 [Paralcaligenes ureilyticus]|uniref:Uncharacterized protein n=1 Tax=Paralcaligenes ureilyticus TaxID=627131 RepID=A0A4R3LVL4_9BURK|nr:hypothetical protein EDC26_11425 [Paralcaligenes ureilyticus]
MGIVNELAHYMEHLAKELGHADRHARLNGYCTVLMLPLSRKSAVICSIRSPQTLRASRRGLMTSTSRNRCLCNSFGRDCGRTWGLGMHSRLSCVRNGPPP